MTLYQSKVHALAPIGRAPALLRRWAYRLEDAYLTAVRALKGKRTSRKVLACI